LSVCLANENNLKWVLTFHGNTGEERVLCEGGQGRVIRIISTGIMVLNEETFSGKWKANLTANFGNEIS
jgi:hypothetical protein